MGKRGPETVKGKLSATDLWGGKGCSQIGSVEEGPKRQNDNRKMGERENLRNITGTGEKGRGFVKARKRALRKKKNSPMIPT